MSSPVIVAGAAVSSPLVLGPALDGGIVSIGVGLLHAGLVFLLVRRALLARLPDAR